MKRHHFALPALILAGAALSFADMAAAQNWTADLTFQVCPDVACAAPKPDALSITIGENTASDELLKPPPLPGKSITGDDTDAIVDAHLKGGSARLARKVRTASGTGGVWALSVDVEDENKKVQIDIDPADVPSDYKIVVVDLDADGGPAVEELDNSGGTVELFTTPAGGSLARNVLVSVGPNSSFGRLAPGEKPCARIVPYGSDSVGSMTVKVDSSPITVSADGVFCASKTYDGGEQITIEATRPHFLKRIVSGTVPSEGDESLAIGDLAGGDANSDGKVNIQDFGQLRNCYGTCTDDCLDSAAADCSDFNGDQKVNIQDFGLLRASYGQKDDE